MKKSVNTFYKKKETKEKITMLTCYDYSTARFLAKTDLDSILIGDSLGMVFQGKEDTLSVTIDELIYHTKAVRRGAPDIFIIADMPFLSYHVSPASAVENAGRFIKEAGANAVKVEGGLEMVKTIEAMIAAKIPVIGHLGLTPQSINMLGGFKVQGKSEEQAKQLISDAKALEEAGAFAIVLECIPEKLAKIITDSINIPTIGIGSGAVCDGQVLVINDILGMYPEMCPKFVKIFANVGGEIEKGINGYIEEVKSGTFPGKEHSYKIDDDIIERLY